MGKYENHGRCAVVFFFRSISINQCHQKKGIHFSEAG